MASNGQFDRVSQYARLSERVENQGKDIVDLRSNMNTGFQSLNSNINALANEVRNNTKTPWPVIWSAIGVCFAIMAAAATFLYGTLTRSDDRLDTQIAALSATVVPRAETEWRTARAAEDRQRTDKAILDIREDQVPRAELDRVFQGYDQRLADHQRQIDEVKQVTSEQYNQKDLNRDILERVDRIERERIRSGGVGP